MSQPTQGQLTTPFLSPSHLAQTPDPQPAFLSPPTYGGRICQPLSPYHLAPPHQASSTTSSISSPHGPPADKLRGLGGSPWPGRVAYPIGAGTIHPAFAYPTGMAPMVLCLSDGGDIGPFKPAPSPTVIMSPLCPTYVATMRTDDAESAAYTASQLFSRLVRGIIPPNMISLTKVNSNCGFFSKDIFHSLKQGMVATATDLDKGSMRSSEFSVLHFLRFRAGENHVSLLPAAGWSDRDDALRFINSIQWFLTHLFSDKGTATFMHRGLTHLLSLINTNTMLHAWPSINKRYFSLVVVHATHSLWTNLLLWGTESHKFNIYYLHQKAPVQVGGAAPFSASTDTIVLDAKLHEWCSQMEQRFPKGALELPGAFMGTIPATMEHIFAPPTAPWSPTPLQLLQGQQLTTNPDQDTSQSHQPLGLFERISGAPTGRREVLKPYPKFKLATGELIEICFSHACAGMSCRPRTKQCSRAHLSIPGTRAAPRLAWEGVRTWMLRPEVKARVRLTQAAAAIPGLL